MYWRAQSLTIFNLKTHEFESSAFKNPVPSKVVEKTVNL